MKDFDINLTKNLVKSISPLATSETHLSTREETRRRKQNNHSHRHMRHELEYQKIKSDNLAAVVSDAVQTIHYLNQQLSQTSTEAIETEVILQDRVRQLENRVADLTLQNVALANTNRYLTNTNEYLLNNPVTVFYVSPIIVVEPTITPPVACSLRPHDGINELER